jgi:hypothetical protein
MRPHKKILLVSESATPVRPMTVYLGAKAKTRKTEQYPGPRIVCTACGSSDGLTLSKLGCYLCAKCRPLLEGVSL